MDKVKVEKVAKAMAMAVAAAVVGGCCQDQICSPGPVDAVDTAPKIVLSPLD